VFFCGAYWFTKTATGSRQIFAAVQKVLSPREQAILAAVASGKTSQIIAQDFDLSRRTVENHRYRIMKKLNLQTTSEIVKFALKHGLISE
jgi:DNA-binding NarL/FixJ family response regulator